MDILQHPTCRIRRASVGRASHASRGSAESSSVPLGRGRPQRQQQEQLSRLNPVTGGCVSLKDWDVAVASFGGVRRKVRSVAGGGS